jgi:hypothetical protein
MCQQVIINRGEIEIQTVRQFREYFKTDTIVPDDAYDKIDDDCCLCQIDIGAELRRLNIPHKWDFMDYYVGQIDQIVDDDVWQYEEWKP